MLSVKTDQKNLHLQTCLIFYSSQSSQVVLTLCYHPLAKNTHTERRKQVSRCKRFRTIKPRRRLVWRSVVVLYLLYCLFSLYNTGTSGNGQSKQEGWRYVVVASSCGQTWCTHIYKHTSAHLFPETVPFYNCDRFLFVLFLIFNFIFYMELAHTMFTHSYAIRTAMSKSQALYGRINITLKRANAMHSRMIPAAFQPCKSFLTISCILIINYISVLKCGVF